MLYARDCSCTYIEFFQRPKSVHNQLESLFDILTLHHRYWFAISAYETQYTVMLEKSARIILSDLNKIAHLHIVCDFNLCDDSQG